MSAPHPASIRRKLTALTLTVVVLPVFCVQAIVAVQEIRRIRTDMLASSALMGSVVAEYSAAALAFRAQPAAENALQTLARHEEFLDAALYDTAGHLFASAERADNAGPPPPLSFPADAPQTQTLEGDRCTVVRAVESEGARFGTLVLHTSTAPLTSRVHAYLWGLLWLTIVMVVAWVTLAWALERLVSRRLARLADVARGIADKEDYTVRAQVGGSADEIGLLAAAFNRMLAEIEVRQEQAHEAVHARDEFLSVASHELKTPLTSLKLQTQGLLELPPPVPDAADAKRLRDSLALIERQVRRLERLINNLLDVSRIAMGRFELQVDKEVDMVPLVRDVVAQFAAEIARSGSSVTLRLPERAVGDWDHLRLEQVVVNLLSNALKYGAGKPIDVALEVDDARMHLRVRDHGIGIDPLHHERVFQRFERAVSVDYGGVGLGLYITRQIVLSHGGSISLESLPSVGSTFVVDIPRHGEGGA